MQEDNRNKLPVPQILVRRRNPHNLLGRDCRGRHLALARHCFLPDIRSSKPCSYPILVSLGVALTRLPHQVLAVFMAVPPMIEVAHSAAELWHWLINLRWIRYITRRPIHRAPSPEEMGTPETEFADWQQSEKKGTVDGQSSLVAEAPRLGIDQSVGHLNGATD